ncbi:pirin family protein [Solimicrobium silvestre]|uniref:Pirin-related protein n=1 Tax=Solimicrobium silvestre TaxID=2099400 RepID=A0A2S9GUZ4_9BURK|nr:pirin family protein [Solimicrobium silvestre]PRC91539.1 Pirin-related protein [Solimicrobium silvestre]
MDTQNTQLTTQVRSLQREITGLSTSDGAGVKLLRSLGSGPHARLDPFLMLDEFSSNNPDDYVAGFPSHPHRGFDTVTYLLDGHMRHEDHMGNVGHIKSGGVQWMSAGRGVIHSEMPQQEQGRMRGFQLWINLPAREKMKPAGYQDIQPEQIPVIHTVAGGFVKVIAGSITVEGTTALGPIQGVTTEPVYLDVMLSPNSQLSFDVAELHHAFVYVYEGQLQIGERSVKNHSAGILSEGGKIEVRSLEQETRFLVLAGKPIGEPVVQYGPFVMNTRAEVEQAVSDYQNGILTHQPAVA